jgi:hypothetical protein
MKNVQKKHLWLNFTLTPSQQKTQAPKSAPLVPLQNKLPRRKQQGNLFWVWI